MELLRSLLFVPGNRPNMMEKARTLPADVLVLDLEDSVPWAEKGAARESVKKSLPGLVEAGQRVIVRVNSPSTGLLQEDLREVTLPGLWGITLPKVESAKEVEEVSALLGALQGERGLGEIRLIPWAETAMGVLKAFEIASSSPRVVGLAFGAEDFTLDMGIERSTRGEEVFQVRAQIAIVARAARVTPLDTVYVDFRDEEGLRKDTRLSRQLGFRGRFLIHPSQVGPVNEIFSPTPEEVDYARRVMEAFAEAQKRGWASTSLEGKMIDTPVAERARRLLALAEAIAKRKPRS